MKKTIILSALALTLSVSAFAQDAAPVQHLKFYGFIRTYFAFDTHESSSGTGDLFFYMPKDQKLVDGVDMYEMPQMRFLALTSRFGLDVLDYEFKGYKMAAKIEADFYSGLTSVSGTTNGLGTSSITGTAQMRLRQAYVTVAKGGRSWKIGQAWHPLAIDLPDIFSLESGAPFGAFSRTPQVLFNGKLSEKVSLDLAAIWQQQYMSPGPEGNSANYIKYGCLPELYCGFNFKPGSSLIRVGIDMLSIKPRQYNSAGTAKVKDRITTVNLFEYGQFKAGNWTLREKVIYANDGSHMNLVGGYGVCDGELLGDWKYTATRNLSTWFTAMYKTKNSPWSPSIFLGYIKNFGTPEDIIALGDLKASWEKLSASSVNQMYRIQPEVIYSIGKLQFGLEYMLTAVQYGKSEKRMVAVNNLHWVANNRIQALVKYTF